MRIGNKIVTASALGKRRRMFRIFGDKGKCIVVPLDDNLISKYNEGLKNLHDKIKDIQQAKPNGVLCYLGTASIIDKYEVPIILNLTASTEYKTHTKKILVSTIEQAIAIDAAAVAVHINVSSSYESIMLENLGAVSEVCQKYGMPLLVIVYPRTEHAGKDYNYEDLKKENEAEQSSHKTVFAKVPAMGQIWRDFGHAFSFASSSSRGIYPSPSYLIWMCCTRFPLDLFGAST